MKEYRDTAAALECCMDGDCVMCPYRDRQYCKDDLMGLAMRQMHELIGKAQTPAAGEGWTMDQYQALAARTINERLDAAELINHALHGLASEVGEIHGAYQKVYQGHTLSEDKLKKELGDVMWFAAELCTAMGWTMQEIAEGNIEKLRGRYPDGFRPERSLNRDA